MDKIEVLSMSPEELKRWTAERRSGVQNGHFGVESIEWRDYHSKWHKCYWDLVYKKDSIVWHYRKLNHEQVSMLMERDFTIVQLNEFIEEVGLKDKYAEWQEEKLRQAKQILGLRASKYIGTPDE